MPQSFPQMLPGMAQQQQVLASQQQQQQQQQQQANAAAQAATLASLVGGNPMGNALATSQLATALAALQGTQGMQGVQQGVPMQNMPFPTLPQLTVQAQAQLQQLQQAQQQLASIAALQALQLQQQVAAAADSDTQSQPSQGSQPALSTPTDDSLGSTMRLVVKRLAPWMDEAWIASTFSKFGPIKSHRSVTGLGYGFVEYVNKKDCERAILEMNGAQPEGSARELHVMVATERETSTRKKAQKVYISGFKRALTAPELRKVCEAFGELEGISVLSKRAHSDGVCFARFVDVEDASRCCEELNNKNLVSQSGETVRLTVRYADVVGKHHQRRKL